METKSLAFYIISILSLLCVKADQTGSHNVFQWLLRLGNQIKPLRTYYYKFIARKLLAIVSLFREMTLYLKLG